MGATLLCGCTSLPSQPLVGLPAVGGAAGDQGSHILLYGNLPDAGGARILGEADLTVRNVCSVLELNRPDAPTRVFLFDSRWTLWRFLRRRCPPQSGSPAACFEAADSCVVALYAQRQVSETLRYLRHELTHSVIATRFSDVPPWLHEGLAQLFERGAPYSQVYPALLGPLARQIRGNRNDMLARLVRFRWGEPLGQEEYEQAWGLTYFIIVNFPGGPALIRNYLERVRSGADAERQFEEAFGHRPSEMERAWRAYILGLPAGGGAEGDQGLAEAR